MRNHSPETARRALWILFVIVGLFIGLATWLTTRTIGQVEMIQQASDSLELRNFRVGARLRAQIYRLSSVMLRYEVTGVATFREQFSNYREELDTYLEEQSPLLTGDEETQLMGQIHNELAVYYSEAEEMFKIRVSDSSSIERVERAKSQLDSVVELTYRLADFRRAEFRQLLADYRKASRRLERYIFLAVGALLAAATLMAWLAYQAYMNPVQRELSEAKTIAHQKEELATVGALAGGIAHEIRNPITGIRARSFALAQMLEKGSLAAKQAAVIDEEATRMERILNDFLDFARPQEPNVERCDLREMVAELHAFHLPEIDALGVDFRLEIQGEEPFEAQVDPALVRQVLTNLVRNAGESFSLGDGGVVTLSLRQYERKAIFSVRDNGAGMPPAVAKRMFEPFFSKKRGGTGLGLAISQLIVEKHGGVIVVESTEGVGTTIRVELPMGTIRSNS
jgi:signal transduction histidine kinase